MSTGNARTKLGGRSRVIAHHGLGTRAALVGLGALGMAVPLAAAILAAVAIEQQLADGLPHWQRIAWTVLGAVMVLSAVDSTLGNTTSRLHQRLHGRVHGPRTWSCEDCGASITAARWTPYEAATFEEHLGDPDAHGCTGTPQH